MQVCSLLHQSSSVLGASGLGFRECPVVATDWSYEGEGRGEVGVGFQFAKSPEQ